MVQLIKRTFFLKIRKVSLWNAAGYPHLSAHVMAITVTRRVSGRISWLFDRCQLYSLRIT